MNKHTAARQGDVEDTAEGSEVHCLRAAASAEPLLRGSVWGLCVCPGWVL